jgi:membrane-associated HD superfamily phosphohydrolase
MNLRPLRPDQHQKHPTRWSYQQGSEDFIGWVNSLGIEKTILGRFLLWVDRYLQLKRSLGILLFFMFLSFFISWDVDTRFAGYKEGDLAAGDIRSPLSFSVLDEDETHIRRKQSEENIPPVYDYDVGAYDRLILDFRQTMRRFRVEGGSLSEFKDQLPQAQLSKESFSWMSELRFKSALEATVVRTLEKWQGLRVLDDLPSGRNTKFIARILERGNRGDEFLVEVTSVTTTSELKKQIQENSYMGPFKTKSDQRQLKELIKGLISPNFSLNKHETEERRRLARESVEESRINLKKGQIIIRQGAPFTKSHLMILDELTQIQNIKKYKRYG